MVSTNKDQPGTEQDYPILASVVIIPAKTDAGSLTGLRWSGGAYLILFVDSEGNQLGRYEIAGRHHFKLTVVPASYYEKLFPAEAWQQLRDRVVDAGPHRRDRTGAHLVSEGRLLTRRDRKILLPDVDMTGRPRRRHARPSLIGGSVLLLVAAMLLGLGSVGVWLSEIRSTLATLPGHAPYPGPHASSYVVHGLHVAAGQWVLAAAIMIGKSLSPSLPSRVVAPPGRSRAGLSLAVGVVGAVAILTAVAVSNPAPAYREFVGTAQFG